MNEAEIITPWGLLASGANIAQLALDHELTQTDTTEQANVPPDPNLHIVLARMTDAVLADIESDATYEVLWSESVTTP